MSRKPFFAVFLSLSTLGVTAEYTFTPNLATGDARVVVRLTNGDAKEFRMPAWAPGDYDLLNYGRYVEGIRFTKAGKVVPFAHSATDVNLWSLPQGADTAIYTIKPSRGNFSPNLRVTATQTFASGPGVFGWFEGDQRNRQYLNLALLPTGSIAFTTLEQMSSAPAGFAALQAPNYDEMIDAPFVVGTGIRVESFTVHGKPMKIVGYNRPGNADLAGFAKVGRAAAEQTYALFGELPFPRYYFFCDFGGGGGGLEHLNSTRLGLGQNATGEGATGLIFHEFFHLYNVKRIRPKGLGPFDYTKPLLIDTIWWLEGVTDYFASVLAVRAGLESRDSFLSDASSSLAGFSSNSNALKISADESSRRVWEGRGSHGYGINYYEKGWLIGMCLDLAIRGQSKGRHSLDDVIQQLFEETKNDKPGYEESRIRELCIKYGGAALGPIYDKCAKQAVELPIAELAKGVGMIWDGKDLFADPLARSPAKEAGMRWPLAVAKF